MQGKAWVVFEQCDPTSKTALNRDMSLANGYHSPAAAICRWLFTAFGHVIV